ncbi:Hypothetical protein PP7435_CHR2-0638 [Komagataella phaffii CBS 7435]|uniref:F-box domain-containing protein n=2 Tax=Komagataella phaffii TaxID=460519 RepID=C4R1B2_KOMPG|nr:Hypothetical protein PAS_chr2-1_0642 [Komagataella phaffii GS115]AOA62228.1 GQ67_00705T0 [Komagataella phaffii]CAH2448187.1 Hypothetical protein BQ9382_C2-3470 [Komagataella phaffii CBS 7435]AOA67348.1 GQ68_00684T0 [Komagataella phaffii GS115]CAY69286.1 Hypothetical protein PAS_chr2-1_0642 [Komagataella phaffii GS115]CCA38325.1 Hypothetical protein PP7435_CHR2-0638 [Komagataella phaffii CBS 7435]
MTSQGFLDLPLELASIVIEQVDSRTLCRVLKSNRQMRSLSLEHMNSKLKNILGAHQENLFISVFSPQSVESDQVCTYETSCVTSQVHSGTVSVVGSKPNEVNENTLSLLNSKLSELKQMDQMYPMHRQMVGGYDDATTSTYQLGGIRSTRRLMTNDGEEFVAKDSKLEDSFKNVPMMTLLVDEECDYIKFHFSVSIKSADSEPMHKVIDISKNVSKHETSGEVHCEGIKVAYKLHRGEILPPRSPYDYDMNCKYQLEFQEFEINNCYLMEMVDSI